MLPIVWTETADEDLVGITEYIGENNIGAAERMWHGKAVILVVKAGLMFQNKISFYRANNGVWLVPSVSPAYLAF